MGFPRVAALAIAVYALFAGSELAAQVGVAKVGYLTSASAQAGGDGTNPSSLSFSFDSNTVPDAVKSCLVVAVSIRKGAGALPSVSSITFNGVGFTQELFRLNTAGTLAAEMWDLVGPPMGNFTVTVTLTGAAESIVAGIVQATNVNQASPVRSSTSARNAGSATATQTITSATGDLVVDVLAVTGDITATVGSGQTQRWNRNTAAAAASLTGAGSTEPGATSVVMDWTLSASTAWVAVSLSLQPDAVTASSDFHGEAVAVQGGKGVDLRWRADDGGRQILGFNVVRAGSNGQRRGANVAMIAGPALLSSALLATDRTYTYFDPEGTADSSYFIESITLNGTFERSLPIHTVTGGGATLPETSSVSLGALSESRATSHVVLPGTDQNVSAQSAGPWAVGAGAAVKIGVDAPGWYRVTLPELLAAGLSPTADPTRLQLWSGGSEVAMKVSPRWQKGPAWSIQFYGTPLDTVYSGSRVYWLIEGQSPGKRVASSASRDSSAAFATGYTEVELRERSIYYAAAGGGDDGFFGALVSPGGAAQVVSARGIDPSTGDASLVVRLQGVTAGDHLVEASLNGAVLGSVSFRDKGVGSATFRVRGSDLAEGDNTVVLRSLGSTDFSLVDRIHLTYPRTSVAWSDELAMTTAGAAGSVRIGGFSTDSILAFDLTDPAQPIELVGTIRDGAIVVPGGSDRVLYAVATTRVKRPAFVRANTTSSLGVGGADYLVITHKAFRSAADRLARFRSTSSLPPGPLSTRVVDVEDVYDEFGYGAPEPSAIGSFLAYAAASWHPAPQFVVLLGDGSFDPRDYLGGAEKSWIPTPLIQTEYFQASSDDSLVDFNGDGIPDVALGRFPVQTLDQANAAVQKLESYSGSQTPASRRALLVADLNEGSNFEVSSDALRALLPSTASVSRAYRETVGSDVARQALLDSLAAGSFLVNYAGHGSVDSWRGDVLSSNDASALPPNSHPPLVTVESCLTGYFMDFTLATLGEALFRAPGGGAIAVLASSGINRPYEQDSLMREFYRRVFATAPMTLGNAALAAKKVVSGDVRRTSTLLGDPALYLSY